MIIAALLLALSSATAPLSQPASQSATEKPSASSACALPEGTRQADEQNQAGALPTSAPAGKHDEEQVHANEAASGAGTEPN